jgi:aspartokinase/homoserine dehydrogenase 1
MKIPFKGRTAPTGIGSPSSSFFSEHATPYRSIAERMRAKRKKPLRVMKFGGTSVGQAEAIERVVEIVGAAVRESAVVVVVSAMSGVTNQLLAAARHSEAGDYTPVAAIFAELRLQHEAAARALLHSVEERIRLGCQLEELFREGERMCQGSIRLRELTPPMRDAISSLGERLSVLLVAAALADDGVASQAVEATELVITNACHGSADPSVEITRERSQARLGPLLQQQIVPVVTGFIGSTADGILTTLGRGGSDYSATILGAALDAEEVIIWTDVDGLQTSDPRQVAEARTIQHISYREAAELAHFGAKVLHPKTLRPVMQCGTPLWIRNTFAPERRGTQITLSGPPRVAGVKALTALSDVVLIAIGGPGLASVPDVLSRTLRTAAAAGAEALLLWQASSQNKLSLIVSSAHGTATLEAFRHEFSHELGGDSAEHISLDVNIAIVTVVGQNLNSIPGIVDRALVALERAGSNILAIAPSVSESAISIVVSKPDVQTALKAIHHEFQLGAAWNRTIAACATGDENSYVPCEPVVGNQIPDQGDYSVIE